MFHVECLDLVYPLVVGIIGILAPGNYFVRCAYALVIVNIIYVFFAFISNIKCFLRLDGKIPRCGVKPVSNSLS